MPPFHVFRSALRLALKALAATLLLQAAARAESQPLVPTYETAEWQSGLLRFDQDGIDHVTATVSYGADTGIVVYCTPQSVIALRVDPYYPKGGVTPSSQIRFVVKSGDTSIYDQTLSPFTFADNSYGGAIPKALAEAMKRGSSLSLSDPTIGLDQRYPLRGSSKALAGLTCI
ncbi:MAG: hypothetical protein Kilf2KO_40110 [Rhodospirillales bacterium]